MSNADWAASWGTWWCPFRLHQSCISRLDYCLLSCISTIVYCLLSCVSTLVYFLYLNASLLSVALYPNVSVLYLNASLLSIVLNFNASLLSVVFAPSSEDSKVTRGPRTQSSVEVGVLALDRSLHVWTLLYFIRVCLECQLLKSIHFCLGFPLALNVISFYYKR